MPLLRIGVERQWVIAGSGHEDLAAHGVARAKRKGQERKTVTLAMGWSPGHAWRIVGEWGPVQMRIHLPALKRIIWKTKADEGKVFDRVTLLHCV